MTLLIVGILAACAIVAVVLLVVRLSKLKAEHLKQIDALEVQHKAEKEKLDGRVSELLAKYSPIVSVEREVERIRGEAAKRENEERSKFQLDLERLKQDIQQLTGLAASRKEEAQTLERSAAELRSTFRALDEEANLRDFGFYKPLYEFQDSNRYQLELERIRERQKTMIQGKTAAVCHTEWQVNGSATEGRKQINQTLRLLLRAFNGECDAAISKVRYNNIHVMENRINASFAAINKSGETQTCHIVQEYLNLKLAELHLVHEYQEKVQEEKEEQRRIREQMREEEIALREFEKTRDDAEREEKRYQTALEKARIEVEKAVGEKQERLAAQIEELQQRLKEAQERKERAIARAQMTRSGHVYVISNIGSFGESVYKIGMTRRLDPMDRVRELGDASVPFLFDVHAIIFTEDAPKLENGLHKAFESRRVNLVNGKKEFFKVDLEEIAAFVRKNHGEITFTKVAEAKEYRQTLAKTREGSAS